MAGDADAVQLSEAVAACWQDIDAALHPIIGHRGVAALYHRSLKRCTPAHPWLAALSQDLLAAMDLSLLKSVLAQQTTAEAAAAGHAVFDAFRSLLASLIGTALTDRLLDPVWAHTAGNTSAQDISP